MQMRELNVNTAPRRSNGPRKQGTSAQKRHGAAPAAPSNGGAMATFISPPRNPAAMTMATATNAPTQYVAENLAVEDFTPEQMLAMAEASYAKCPCVTCAAYREFYAKQVAEADAARATTEATTTPLPDAGDAQCPPAVLDNDLPSPSAPAGSYYFVPRPASRAQPPQPPQPPQQQPYQQQPQHQQQQPMPASTGGYQRGSLRQQLGAVPLLAIPSGAGHDATVPYSTQRPSLSPDPVQLPPAFAPSVRHDSAANNTSRYTDGVNTKAHPGRGSTSAVSAARHAEVLEQFHESAPGRVVELACTQEGKMLLQAALRVRDASVVAAVVSELCTDMDAVALDANACHVLRLSVELCSLGQLIDVVGTFHETLLLNMCTVSQYTRRTLQALMDRQDATIDGQPATLDFTPVVEVLANNAAYLSVTQQGCISLMRVFERCRPEQKILLMSPLVPSLAVLAFDPFGNYVTQCAMEHSDVLVAAEYVLSCFQNQLLRMSCDKFASNVVEKIIRACSGVPEVRAMLLDELFFNPASLQELIMDGFGNFVVQSVIDSCTDACEFKRISDRLTPILASSPYAVRIEGKLKSKRLYAGAPFAPTPQSQSQSQSRPMTAQPADTNRQMKPMQQWQPPQQRGSRYAPVYQPTAASSSYTNATVC